MPEARTTTAAAAGAAARHPHRPRLPAVATLTAALVAVLAGGAAGPAAAQGGSPTVRIDEPRAFGYSVGSVLTRDVHLTVPDGLVLDDASLPAPGRRGGHLELRSLERTQQREGGATQVRLRMTYQVFLSPTEVRTLEVPPFRVRYLGTPAGQETRVEAWPVTVSPLVPVDVSPRTGLGEWRPDQAPLPLGEQGHRVRLAALASAAVLVGLYLLQVHVGLPWLARRQRPFAQAWKAVQPLTDGRPQAGDPAAAWQQALQAVHAALNRTAGRTVFAADVDAFVAEHPRFAPVRDDLLAFFGWSRQAFFLGADRAPAADAWSLLRALARRCRDVERGTA